MSARNSIDVRRDLKRVQSAQWLHERDSRTWRVYEARRKRLLIELAVRTNSLSASTLAIGAL